MTLKQIVVVVSTGLTVLSTQALAQLNPMETRVALNPEVKSSFQAGKIHFEFELVDTQLNKALSDKDLKLDQERILHLYMYDPALSEFRHEHPIFNGKVWSTDTDLNINGHYWVWVQGRLASDNTAFLAANRLEVEGGLPANALPPKLGDVRTGSDGDTVLTVDNNALYANDMVMLTAIVTHKDGSAPQITNWLGARAHITTVSADGASLIHSHPMNLPEPNQFMIHLTFPKTGEYRIWVQFMDGGQLKTVPLAVTVQE